MTTELGYKALRLISIAEAQRLGLPAEGPVFTSPYWYRAATCVWCAQVIPPLVYGVGQVTATAHAYNPRTGAAMGGTPSGACMGIWHYHRWSRVLAPTAGVQEVLRLPGIRIAAVGRGVCGPRWWPPADYSGLSECAQAETFTTEAITLACTHCRRPMAEGLVVGARDLQPWCPACRWALQAVLPYRPTWAITRVQVTDGVPRFAACEGRAV